MTRTKTDYVSWLASITALTISHRNYPVVSNNVWRLRARWPMIRLLFSRTNQPLTSTTKLVEIIDLMVRLKEEKNVTIISATHDHEMLAISDRVVDS